jgi:hypothetical protein
MPGEADAGVPDDGDGVGRPAVEADELLLAAPPVMP